MHLDASAKTGLIATVPEEVERLDRLTATLLDNAMTQACPGGAIRVKGFPDARFVGLQTPDKGTGFTPGDVERVFDKFDRATNGMPGAPGRSSRTRYCGAPPGGGERSAIPSRLRPTASTED